jgi:hypothetical protein
MALSITKIKGRATSGAKVSFDRILRELIGETIVLHPDRNHTDHVNFIVHIHENKIGLIHVPTGVFYLNLSAAMKDFSRGVQPQVNLKWWMVATGQHMNKKLDTLY